jgi:serine/threonine-protein kinase
MHFTPATWAALSRLLDEALERDAAARAEWLRRIATTHPDLAPLLRTLLAAHATSEAGDVLSRLPQLDAPAHDATEVTGLAVGSLVGPYRLTREIGSGGMAEVWLAERADGAFERELALKLPRLTCLRRDLAARFRHERDILARLEHPHIARFYDAGVSSDGLPYLAMEYVDGQPITTWCDACTLAITARLRLFAQVLDAVRFAHANLVIHRDLKPSNVLVTSGGQVRLLDFGIAKLLAAGQIAPESQLTQLAGRALTPDYASPEQIKGEALTTATDVYSLGVMLYELLTGQLPYRLKVRSAAQLEQAIVTADPARPSAVVSASTASARGSSQKQLTRMLGGDLERIVLKALAKEPAQRYGSVAELAEDLRRYQTGQTVHARPTSWSYRARKLAMRNRLAVGAATAISVALIAAAAVSFWQARLARQQAQIAHQQATRAEEVKDFVLSLFDAANVDRGGRRQTTAVDLLQGARDRLKVAPIADDATRIELLTTLGWAMHGLGELRGAESLLADAARLASTTSRDNDRIAAQALAAYGTVLVRRGELEIGATQLAAAEQRSRRVGDTSTLVMVLLAEADLRAKEGQYESAIRLAREPILMVERDPLTVDKADVIQAHEFLADFTREAFRPGALEIARAGMALARELYGDRATPTYAHMRRSYALALADAGDVAGGLAQLQEARRLQSELLGANHLQVARSHRHLANLFLMLGDPTSAEENVREALRIATMYSAGEPTMPLAAAKFVYGGVLADARRYDTALTESRDADAAYTAVYGADSEAARLARSGVGLALTGLGQLEQAQTVFDSLRARAFRSSREEAIFKERLGLLRSAQGKHTEALQLLRDAARFFAAAPSEWARALALAHLGGGLLAGGETKESLVTLQRARTILLKIQGNGSPDLAEISVDIARAQLALGHADEALTAAQEAAAFWLRFDPDNRYTGVALLWQARALTAADNAQKAADFTRRAGAILATSGLPSDRALLLHAQRELAARQSQRQVLPASSVNSRQLSELTEH